MRDYVHTEDLAQAHQLAVEALEPGMGRAYNIGSGTGVTVLEVLRACEEVVGRPIRHEIVGRRPGDPAVLIATPEKIVRELGWSPRYPVISATSFEPPGNGTSGIPMDTARMAPDGWCSRAGGGPSLDSAGESRENLHMSLAYLLNWYPQPSQTALRREVAALEELGVAFHRFSLAAVRGRTGR